MSLLDIKTRQSYLKELGFYTGEIDGSAGPLTRQAYRSLQNKFFKRAKDKDGSYGPDTDKLLRSVWNCHDIKNFKVTEFRCPCGNCTGYPAEVNRNLVLNLQKVREHYGKSIIITSGLRCPAYNKRVGGISNSNHLIGKSADIYITGGQSNSYSGRKGIVDYWDTLENAKYAYFNGYIKYAGKRSSVCYSKTMGNATHVNVK